MEINDRKYNKHSRHQLQLTLSELDLLMSAIRKSDPASIKKKENPAIVLDGSRNKLIFMGGTVAFSSQQPPAESDKQRWVDIILAFRDLEVRILYNTVRINCSYRGGLKLHLQFNRVVLMCCCSLFVYQYYCALLAQAMLLLLITTLLALIGALCLFSWISLKGNQC